MRYYLLISLLLISCVTQPSPQPVMSPPAVTHHSVTLTWLPSPTPNVTYRVRRADCQQIINGICTMEGMFAKIADISALTYIDNTVQSKQEYSYYVTAVNVNNVESIPSNSVGAKIP